MGRRKTKFEYYTVGKLDSPNGWITDKGEFLACDYRGHLYAAEEYFNDKYGGEDKAEKAGWIKISDFQFLCWGWGTPLKQCQIDTIWDWYSHWAPTHANLIGYYGSRPGCQDYDTIIARIKEHMPEA